MSKLCNHAIKGFTRRQRPMTLFPNCSTRVCARGGFEERTQKTGLLAGLLNVVPPRAPELMSMRFQYGRAILIGGWGSLGKAQIPSQRCRHCFWRHLTQENKPIRRDNVGRAGRLHARCHSKAGVETFCGEAGAANSTAIRRHINWRALCGGIPEARSSLHSPSW